MSSAAFKNSTLIVTVASLTLLISAVLLFSLQAYRVMLATRFTLTDDAYISLRYAWNWANGVGVVWQPGDRVEGYTNFLQVALLALGLRLGADGETVAYVIGWTAGFASLLVAFLLARAVSADARAGLWAGGTAALLLAALPDFAFWSMSGMETPLFVLLCLTALWLLARTLTAPERIARAALLGGALAGVAMTRPDGLLLTGAVVGAMGLAFRRDRAQRRSVGRALLAALTVFAVIYGWYFLWRLTYYGQLWPNTFYVKVGSSPKQIERGVDYVWRMLHTMGLYPLVLGAALSAAPWRQWLGRADRDGGTPRLAVRMAIVGFGALYLAYLIYIGGDHFGPRLALAVVAVLVMLSADALVEMAAALRRADVRAVIASVAVVCFFATTFHFARTMKAFSPDQILASVQPNWNRLGLWLKENAPTQSVIAVDAAGAIPYFSQLRAIDMLGLNDLHIAHIDVPDMGAGKPGHEKFDSAYVYSRSPDWIAVLMDHNGSPDVGLSRWPESERYSLYLVVQTIDETRPWHRLVDQDADIRALWDEGYRYGLWKRNERIIPEHREVDFSVMTKRGVWEERRRMLEDFDYLFSKELGATLAFDVEGGGMLALVTICHSWSGMIEVRIADVRYRIDLYASEETGTLLQCVHWIDLPGATTERIPVTIEVLPYKNPASASTEVFLNRVLTFREAWSSSRARLVQETVEPLDLSALTRRGIWEQRPQALAERDYLMSREPGASLEFAAPGGGALEIVTICHDWSGIIAVQIGNQRYRADLYRPTLEASCRHQFDLPGAATERIPVTIEVLPDRNPASASTEVFIQRIAVVRVAEAGQRAHFDDKAP